MTVLEPVILNTECALPYKTGTHNPRPVSNSKHMQWHCGITAKADSQYIAR